MRVRDALYLPKYTKGVKYGVEVEMEIKGNHYTNTIGTKAQWKYERDGSLDAANGAEYVLKAPSTYTDTMVAVNDLYDFIDEHKEDVTISVRPGIHVHINVCDLPVVQLFNLICCNYLMEGIMSSWCGDTRRDNMFCLMSSQAEVLRFTVREAAVRKNLRLFATDEIRYSALNLKALTDYGSIEFRGLNFSTDRDRIVFWIGLIRAMRIVCRMFKSPIHLVEEVEKIGVKGFFNLVGSKHPTHRKDFERYLWSDKCEEEMLEGLEACQDLAYCVEDWSVHFGVDEPAKAIPIRHREIERLRVPPVDWDQALMAVAQRVAEEF